MLGTLAIGILLLISVFTASMPYYIQPAEASFPLTKNLSSNAGFSSDPQIAASGDSVYVLWVDFTPGNWDVFFRASNDNGDTFGSAVNLSKNAGESGRPQIAASGDSVYVLWRDSDDVFFKASNDNGDTFGSAVNLSNNRVGVSEDAPDPSNNAGNASYPKRADLPQIAVSDDHVYVVWVDYIPGDYDIQFRASNDNGDTFGSAVNLETTVGLADLPQIAASDSNVYVIWDDFSLAEGLVMFFRASNDNGDTFGSGANLVNNVGYSDSTPVAVSGDSVYVVSAVGNLDIVFRASNDNGANFGSAVKLSKNPEASSDPHMAVSGDNVYVVWEDYATGNPDIFFKPLIHITDMQAAEKMVLLTDNGSIKVEVTLDREALAAGQPVRFTLNFLDPVTEEPLQDVNYSFMITDEKGNDRVNKLNMHAPEGIDTQTVSFSNTGEFTFSIDVAGLGIDEPYDSTYNGMASTALIVVPEFPLSILAVMGVMLGTAIAITRFRGQLSKQ